MKLKENSGILLFFALWIVCPHPTLFSIALYPDNIEITEEEFENECFPDIPEDYLTNPAYRVYDDVPTRSSIGLPLAVLFPFLQQTISAPIWKRVAPVHTRNLLDLIPAKNQLNDKKRDLKFFPFFNNVPELPLTIGTAFDINLNAMGESLLTQWLGEDGTDLLFLFKKIWVQERNVGFLMNGYFSIGSAHLRFTIPIGITERNFISTEADRLAIESIFDRHFGSDPFLDTFREFVRLRAGIGDTRLSCAFPTLSYRDLSLSMGISTVLPTAFGVELDGRFKKPTSHQDLYLGGGINPIALLENVRDMMLRPELGNNGHVSLGCYLESKFHFARKRYNWWNSFSFDYLFSADQKRLMLDKVTITPEQLLADETLVEAFENQYLAPQELNVRVRPGNVFICTSGLERVWRKWKATVGYNFYLSEEEEFETIKDSNVNLSDLDIHNSLASSLQQHKIFGEFSYHAPESTMPLTLGIGGDYTFARGGGAAHDWTAYAKIAWSF